MPIIEMVLAVLGGLFLTTLGGYEIYTARRRRRRTPRYDPAQRDRHCMDGSGRVGPDHIGGSGHTRGDHVGSGGF